MPVSPKGPITHTNASGDGYNPRPPFTTTGHQVVRNKPVPATMDPAPSGDTPTPTPETPAHQQEVASNVDQSVRSLLNDETYYSPNPLNNLRQPTYKFKLYMTTEHDLLATQPNATIDIMLDTLDKLPRVIIAESGVTAGFNIKDVEIENICGPGWRNKNCMISGPINITITEPLGTSLLESIYTGGNMLGVNNFSKMWYYLELSFVAYNEDGSINTAPLADNPDFTLINRGRWVYQVSINTMDMTMDDTGSTYKLSCMLYPLSAFDDQTTGVIPDVLSVSGKTIGEFCDNFADALNKAWNARYLGDIFTFKIVHHDIPNMNNPRTYGLISSEPDHDPQTLSLDAGANNIPTANLAKETSINDVINFLYANCKEAQKLMLDTNNGLLEDDGGQSQKPTIDGPSATFNGKKYRVPIVPHIESAIVVTGYDPITGQYMQEITYHVWGYKTYGVNITPSQWDNSKRDLAVATDIVKELQQNGFLKKQYQYRFTGLNTEVLRCDLSYNFAFAAILPQLSGWRNSTDSVSVHAKYNPAASQNGGSQTDQATNPSEIARGKNTKAMNTASNTPSNAKVGGDLATYNANVDAAKALKDNPTPGENPSTKKPWTTAELTQNYNQAVALRDGFKNDVTNRRNAFQASTLATRAAIEAKGPTNTYAEDAISDAYALDMTYIQGHGNEPEIAGGTGFTGQWDRGRSLIGAIFNQIYSPAIQQSLTVIELEIRGDPYWLGYSQLDRTAVMNKSFTPTPLTAASAPDLSQGDVHIALIFRFPYGIGPDGSPLIRNDDMYTGVYNVVSVKHVFDGGQFKQVLSAKRVDMVNLLQPTPQVGTDATPAGTTTTTAPSSTLSNG